MVGVPITVQVSTTTPLQTTVHQDAVTATPAAMATYLADLFGQHLVALMTGVDNPRTVGRWAHGQQQPHQATTTRLRDLYQIARLLELAQSRQTVRSWFCGMNPVLGDRAPALVMVDDPDGAHQVMAAARTFLAHG